MKASILPLLLALASTGCVVYDTHSSYVPGDPSPNIHWAEAGCYWDGYYADYIWYFQADVGDPNGWNDVAAVYTDIYDYYTGAPIDGNFELYMSPDGTWFSDWLGYSTYLYCGDPNYVIQFSAYDYEGNYGVYDTSPLY